VTLSQTSPTKGRAKDARPFSAGAEFEFFSDSSKRTDFFDPVKYILFSENPYLYLSLGFEYKVEYEYDDHWMFGAGPQSQPPQNQNVYIMNRVMPHLDFHVAITSAYFLSSNLTTRKGGTVAHSPKSTKTAAMFIRRLEIGAHAGRPHGLSLRVACQEVVLGSGRLFDNNHRVQLRRRRAGDLF
jgi:hypothetical protein